LQDHTVSRYGQLKGEDLVRFVNDAVGGRPLESLGLPLAVVATNLATGAITVFTRGNTGTPCVLPRLASAGSSRCASATRSTPTATSPVRFPSVWREVLGRGRSSPWTYRPTPAVAPFDEIPIESTAEAVTRRALIEAEAPGADIVIRPRLPYYVPHARA
jgi:NTE family protein